MWEHVGTFRNRHVISQTTYASTPLVWWLLAYDRRSTATCLRSVPPAQQQREERVGALCDDCRLNTVVPGLPPRYGCHPPRSLPDDIPMESLCPFLSCGCSTENLSLLHRPYEAHGIRRPRISITGTLLSSTGTPADHSRRGSERPVQ